MTLEPQPQSKTPKIWKNLGARFITAVIFALICLVPLYIGGYAWAVIVTLLGMRLVWEWVRMSDGGATSLTYAIFILSVLFAIGFSILGEFNYAFLSIIPSALMAGFERIRRGGAWWAFLGLIYIVLPVVLILWLRGGGSGLTSEGFRKVFYIIIVVAAADVGAYFGGSLFKGPKMAPALSPNKTWSGFFSGILLGCIIGVGLAYLMGLPLSFVWFTAPPLIIASVVGDFLESGLKRKLDVKDAGTLLPGHGGLLDRVDSLMMAVVVASIALALYPQIWPISAI